MLRGRGGRESSGSGDAQPACRQHSTASWASPEAVGSSLCCFSYPRAAAAAQRASFPASSSLWLAVQAQQLLRKQLPSPAPTPLPWGSLLWPSLACSQERSAPGGQTSSAFFTSLCPMCGWVREGELESASVFLDDRTVFLSKASWFSGVEASRARLACASWA